MTETKAEAPAARRAGAPGGGEELDRPDVRRPLRALAEGELGSLRVLIAIALIWTVFQIRVEDGVFLTAQNLSNLSLQIAAVGTVSIGVVLVLLLGEIDLSVGSVAGLCAAITSVLSVKNGWDPVLAIAAGDRRGRGDRPVPRARHHVLRHPVVRRHAGGPDRVARLPAQGAGRHGHGEPAVAGDDRRPDVHVLLGRVRWVIAVVIIAAYIGFALNAAAAPAAGLDPGDIGLFAFTAVLVAAASRSRRSPSSTRTAASTCRSMIFVGAGGVMAFIIHRTRFGRHSSRSAATRRPRGAPASRPSA